MVEDMPAEPMASVPLRACIAAQLPLIPALRYAPFYFLYTSFMKKYILFLFLLLLPLAAKAQFRFGYLSYGEAVKAMPGYAVAQKRLSSLKEQYDAETRRAEDEFNQKYESFLEGQKSFAPAILKKRQAELQDLLYKNVSFNKEADRLLKQAETDLYMPLYARLDSILHKIGQERGYAFILNTDNGVLPFVNAEYGEDLNAFVREILAKE